LPGYRLSTLAESDLESIARYSVQTWGEEQAHRYIEHLKKCCFRVSESRMLGRSCDRIQKGYRRIEHGSHVVFYREQGDEILIGRILHKSMLPYLHVME